MNKTIKYIYSRLGMARKVGKLNFTAAGIDHDGYPYVEYDGLRFHGKPSNAKDKKYYSILPGSIRRKLPIECFRIAQEIVIRYVESGLMYGGPKKNKYYQVKNGDVAAEMGAYQGFYAMKLCRQVGESGRVVAIEPLPDNLRLLEKNISFNGFDQRCTIVPKGVWQEKATLNFKRKPEDNQSGSVVLAKGTEELLLPVDNLDNIMKETRTTECDMMIIQLNGVEIDALRGLRTFKPKNLAIALRYNKPGMDAVNETIKLLKDRQYVVNLEDKYFVFASLEK